MESTDWANPIIRLTQDAMDFGILCRWDDVAESVAHKEWLAADGDELHYGMEAQRVMMLGD